MSDPENASNFWAPATEAAAAWRVSREIVVRRVQSGGLPGARIGGKWFVLRDALPERNAK